MRPSINGLAAILQVILWSTKSRLSAGFCVSPLALQPPSDSPLVLWASPTPTTSTQYSPATLARVDGLDVAEEQEKLSKKLNISKEKLQNALQNQLANMEDPTSEKAEYIVWLLSGYDNASKPKRKQADNPKVAVKAKKQSKPISASPSTASTSSPSNVRFADRDDLHPKSKRAIDEVLGLTTMTEIQAKTLHTASTGQDLLARARTGSGKTIAFLLVATQTVLQQPPQDDGISILIVSPTRELADQIATQAQQLTTFHRDLSVQVMFGGTNKNTDTRRLNKAAPSVLVATPGRLLDHLQSTRLEDGRPFGNLFSRTSVLVLDETDRLLDMGFRREIEKIVKYLPSSRQTLLFSATIPNELKSVMAQTMRPDFVEVDCIQDGEPTASKVQQTYVIVPQERMVSSVVEIVTNTVQEDPNAKVVVFFPTAKLVNFYAEVFNHVNIHPVMELHSKKSQSYRNRVSQEFRNADSGILFTSDVSARGVDYPNVSHVIQFGTPDSREQYIHRLGRTARADTDGQGYLVLADWEAPFLKELKGVDIDVHEELQGLIHSPINKEASALVEETQRKVRGGHEVLSKSAMGAYRASLGYYVGKLKRLRMNKDDLVDTMNDMGLQTGLYEPPPLTSQMVGKMGLKGVQGLNIKAKVALSNNNGRGGGGRNQNRNGRGRR